jgi:putative transcriptional regulator
MSDFFPEVGAVNWDSIRNTTGQEIEDEAEFEQGRLKLRSSGEGPIAVSELPVVDVRLLRSELQLSQREFAVRFGLSLRTVQQWEQGRAIPDQPARILLLLIASEPEVVASVVASNSDRTGRTVPKNPQQSVLNILGPGLEKRTAVLQIVHPGEHLSVSINDVNHYAAYVA